MDEFERNEMNENPEERNYDDIPRRDPFGEDYSAERNTGAPSGWSYSANTNQYVSWGGNDETGDDTGWNPFSQQKAEQQPPRKEYGTQYGYYGSQPQQPNYYSNNGGSSYQWDFNRYESVNQENSKKPKDGSGKGLKVFLGIIAALLGICIISLTSIAAYKVVANLTADPHREQTYPQITEEEENSNIPEISLQDIPKEEETVTTDGKLSPTAIYKAVSPSVVGVVQYQYSYSFEAAGSGSGIIFSEDGYIVTNAHVIDGAEAVKVVLYNEEEYEAKVIGADSRTDIAVLKIQANNLVAAKFGDSSQMEIGETVYALGNPGGLTLQSSFTDGMVSGLNRVISTDDSIYTMEVIQTSAAINPGNSGGALINEYGQVIGITSSKIVSTDYEGIGFAIPTESAKPIIEEIISIGYVSGRAKLGITGTTVDSVTARYYDVPEGVQIISIDHESSFIGTEVQVGDIITGFKGEEINDMTELQNALMNCSPGDVVEIEIYHYSSTGHGDRSFTVTVELLENKG